MHSTYNSAGTNDSGTFTGSAVKLDGTSYTLVNGGYSGSYPVTPRFLYGSFSNSCYNGILWDSSHTGGNNADMYDKSLVYTCEVESSFSVTLSGAKSTTGSTHTLSCTILYE